jgi:MarR family transcriptional regulator, organic hydroperoxide resistance regulator
MKKETENIFGFDHPDLSVGNLLVRLSNLHQRQINTELSKLNLTYVQFVLLAGVYWLSMQCDEITQIMLINLTKLDKSMTSNVLKTLIEKKLILRKEHSKDTRAKTVSITTVGKKIVKEAVALVEKLDKEFFLTNDFSAEELRGVLLSLIKKNE